MTWLEDQIKKYKDDPEYLREGIRIAEEECEARGREIKRLKASIKSLEQQIKELETILGCIREGGVK